MRNDLPCLAAPLNANAAFIVHLTGPTTETDAVSGRVEHVISGKSLRFTSITQLADFMNRVTACLGKEDGSR